MKIAAKAWAAPVWPPNQMRTMDEDGDADGEEQSADHTP